MRHDLFSLFPPNRSSYYSYDEPHFNTAHRSWSAQAISTSLSSSSQQFPPMDETHGTHFRRLWKNALYKRCAFAPQSNYHTRCIFSIIKSQLKWRSSATRSFSTPGPRDRRHLLLYTWLSSVAAPHICQGRKDLNPLIGQMVKPFES